MKCKNGCQCRRHVPWNKGKIGIYSEETRRKMSQAQMGRISWNKGKHLSEETRQRIAASLKGQIPWNVGKRGIVGYKCNKNCKCGRHSVETRQKMSRSLKGRRVWNKGKTGVYSEETRCKMGLAAKGKRLSKEHRFKIAEAMRGCLRSEETRRRMGVAGKKRWADPEYVKKMMQKIQPNRPELEVLKLIEPYGFFFVGDGQLVIGGKLPDFWDGGGRLVEVYGDYWHRGQDPRERIDLFGWYGYECFVIWEHEILAGETDELLKFVEAVDGRGKCK